VRHAGNSELFGRIDQFRGRTPRDVDGLRLGGVVVLRHAELLGLTDDECKALGAHVGAVLELATQNAEVREYIRKGSEEMALAAYAAA
jgi:hypothetical protein